MPVEGNVYAALVTELEKRLQVDGKSQFLSHPQFLVRLGLNDLLFDAHAVQEHTGLDELQANQEAVKNREVFALIANPIFQPSRTFLPDSRMLWSIYGQVIEAPELAVGGIDNEEVVRTALWFPTLRANFALAERGWGYYDTGVLPPNDVTDPDGWTRIVLDRQLIDDRSRESSPATQAWLEQRGLLGLFEGTGVQGTSLSAEIFLLTLQRPWFEPEVFRNRLWRWDDAPLSDGGDPPQGLLPAYTTRLVLVRKLQIELDVEPAGPGIMAGPVPSTGVNNLAGFAPLAANTDATPQPLQLLASLPDKSRVMNLSQFAKLTLGEAPTGGNALAFGSLSSQTASFPAPVAFLTLRVLKWIAVERGSVANRVAQLSAERSAVQSELDDQEKQVRHMELEVGQWPPDVNVAVIHDPSTNPPTVSEYDVARARAYLAGLRGYLATLQAKAAQLEQAVALQNRDDRDLDDLRQYYEGLSRPGDENDIFVLGFVCSAVPKSPDPDPAFFN